MAKILLVDDAAFMRMVVKDTLTKNGFTDLYEAADGVEAVEKYKEVQPDLVIGISLAIVQHHNSTGKAIHQKSTATYIHVASCSERLPHHITEVEFHLTDHRKIGH